MDFLPDGVSFNKNITYLAKTNFRGQEQVFGIKRRDRRQHMYVLGKSGVGKSVLLENMIVQNIWNGEGVCVVDPHGELVETVLASIPAHRVKDVVYFNPADTDYHIGFNVLEIDDPKYKHLVASGLMGIFTKIWANAWSARMEYILNNAILALGDTPGSTLLGIPRLLVDKDYRQMIVNNLKDPVIKAFWVHEYENWRDQYRNEAIAPIQNKVGQFLSTAMVRNVLGQPKSTINLFEMMNTGKIFLVNVSKGRIGEDNSALLGGMLITKLQLAAMERVRVPEEERKDFYLYVDEFQNFVTDSFASILSEARKYRLCLCLAHQYIAQLVTKDSQAVRDAVFGNVGTMIVFRVGAADADFLEQEFEPEFMVQDMVNLPNYTIYLKLMVDGLTSRPFSAKTLPPYKIPVSENVSQQIIESSRSLYARPRDEVEKEINSWSGMLSGATESGEGKFKAVCSSCSKETTVPFEPEPGRPVYCKDCIAKIKSGELKPLKGAPRSKSLEPQSFAALANIGIEFPLEKETPAPAVVPTPAPAPKPASTAPVASAPASVQKPAFARPAPSNTLIPKTTVADTRPPRPMPPPVFKPQPVVPPVVVRPPQEKKEPDHAGLQEILKQTLGEAMRDITAIPIVKPAVQNTAAPVKPVEQSLSSLSAAPKMTTKVASEERTMALRDAIARAGIVTQIAPKPVVPEIAVPPVLTEISAPTIPTPPIPVTKTVEPVPAPREASLASASQTTTAFVPSYSVPSALPTPPAAPEPKPIEPKIEEKVEPKVEPVPQPVPSNSSVSTAPKRVREVPEDILMKVLNE
jgi:CxxC-x17-CxxC domain-containing protein